MNANWGYLLGSLLLITNVAHGTEVVANGEKTFRPIANATKLERQKTLKPLPGEPVDLNNASREQLESLPGIGPAESARIVAARPFGSKAWLVTNRILPEASYQRIRKAVFVGTPRPEDAAKRPDLFPIKRNEGDVVTTTKP